MESGFQTSVTRLQEREIDMKKSDIIYKIALILMLFSVLLCPVLNLWGLCHYPLVGKCVGTAFISGFIMLFIPLFMED